MSLKIIGKTLGDAISTVAGIAGMAPGAATILGGITLAGGGAALCATGVGAVAGGVTYSGIENGKNDKEKLDSIKNRELDNPDESKLKNSSLSEDIDKAVKDINNETSYGKSSGKIGDFTELEGSNVDQILDRIPGEAVLRELYPVQGGATEGFEFKWVQNGQTYRVRVHNVDPSAPVGSNAYNGWVVRVQRGRRYFDPTINDFREAKYFNPNGPDYDEVIINDTHIPILDPYQN